MPAMPKGSRMNVFLERSLRSALDFFKEAVFSEETAKKKGLLQSVDPRLKTALLIFTLIIACLIPRIEFLIGLYALSLIFAVSSGINLSFFIKRVWVFIPLFALVIAVPAVFIQGLFSAGIFVLRVATCVSFTVLVVLTTRWASLLRSFGSLGIPAIFIQVLDMTYRYIFFFVKVFEEMHMSLKARLIRRFSPKEARHWAASRMGYMFRRSMRMSEDVYMAMLARGYAAEADKYDR